MASVTSGCADVTPISDMPPDEFMNLQALYTAELPICPICSLETVRHVLSELTFGTPQEAMVDGVRQALSEVLFLVTGALVSERTDAEQDDQASN
jgi:hypothetical protein